uniref:Cell division protein ZapA n=1 Tax=Magnetococcus massalia (strain MO-1) TaxID=451514 RepID=A0A1S7LR07_MAGMO|nr:Conserved protein of unknown function [Candidatus Magnetococcus massalia]
MSDMVEVDILGQRFKLNTDTGVDYVQELAKYVENMIEELRQGSAGASQDRLAIMAALQLADRYFQLRQNSEGANELADSRIKRLIEQTDALLTK